MTDAAIPFEETSWQRDLRVRAERTAFLNGLQVGLPVSAARYGGNYGPSYADLKVVRLTATLAICAYAHGPEARFRREDGSAVGSADSYYRLRLVPRAEAEADRARKAADNERERLAGAVAEAAKKCKDAAALQAALSLLDPTAPSVVGIV